MTTILYITAHPHDDTQSFSMAVGKAFIESYKQANPSDQVVHLDLYKENIPHIDVDVFSGWGKLRTGSTFDQLSQDEKTKVQRLSELTDQFVAADKYIFVTPLWNFSFPPVMKAYIDSICTAGKTFRYTEQGPVGLLTDKKALHIQARGGVYSEGPAAGLEMGHRYISVIMNFFGIPSFEGLFVEGHNQFPERAEEIKQQAINKAKEMAQTF
ncbi:MULTISPECIES: FMN-dependent NADH-azoreductase [Fictibacillus]|uniref:FMN dependent NADH:quinone oxidoreductase n=1 Tax=Fictibacillus enclensis TaxID=1017270 RepID=A0A0V8JBU4_9BACL|nr:MULTISPECIES: FMN-dependent NADH-azoreductase [Fictibacillus]KSU84332.1 FMN-dependent NADH-azoreductase [Fictibacillus enclensis]RXZ00044.1 FMN-dependent NADH-azoreductase [Fictibacillus sp. S7]SCB77369.1 FMN-dependent NADH-azoreductase [Fictibacillus enclensis]